MCHTAVASTTTHPCDACSGGTVVAAGCYAKRDGCDESWRAVSGEAKWPWQSGSNIRSARGGQEPNQLARLGRVTRVRRTQVLNLLNLALDIQAAVLLLGRAESAAIRCPVPPHHGLLDSRA